MLTSLDNPLPAPEKKQPKQQSYDAQIDHKNHIEQNMHFTRQQHCDVFNCQTIF